jgi:hypothetical protein
VCARIHSLTLLALRLALILSLHFVCVCVCVCVCVRSLLRIASSTARTDPFSAFQALFAGHGGSRRGRGGGFDWFG